MIYSDEKGEQLPAKEKHQMRSIRVEKSIMTNVIEVSGIKLNIANQG